MAPTKTLGGASHSLPFVLCFLAAATSVFAHSDDAESTPGHGGMTDEAALRNATEYPSTYFAHTGHVGTIYAHITLMIIGWVFILPIAVMLSLSKSRHTLAVQFVFIAVNTVGVVSAKLYNARTPDLYPNNAHHKIGWIITWITSVHILVNLAGRLADTWSNKTPRAGYRILRPLLPGQDFGPYAEYNCHSQESRASDDSGHETASQSSSIRSRSFSTMCAGEGGSSQSEHCREHGDNDDEFVDLPLSSPCLKAKNTRIISHRIWKYVELGYKVIDRVILPFGFIALTTGIITFARFFEGQAVFGGLAHWIKGGVFFWLGIFSLARWSGSFAELGWAWNLRPKTCSQEEQRFRLSAEFVESFLIFLYGSTNIFLEHLGGWGSEWTAQDLEHMSITVLFIGGGLCGMLVESTRVRDLLNATTTAVSVQPYSNEEQEHLRVPGTYEFSLNPIPALVILLLGILMSSHHQATMTASIVHKQWGALLLWASVARGLSYVLFFLKPPKSVFPSRPPTELLTSFGLIAGGVIFMASSTDTVNGMIQYGLDAMFLFTVTMGLVGVLMAWEITVLAIKGWAVRRERSLRSR